MRPLLFVTTLALALAGCGAESAPPSRALATTSQPRAVALDHGQLFWTDGDFIHQVPLEGGQRQSIAAERSTELVISPLGLFWKSRPANAWSGNSRLMQIDASGTRDVTPTGYIDVTPIGVGLYDSLMATARNENTGRSVLLRINAQGWVSEGASFSGELWGTLYVGPPSAASIVIQHRDAASTQIDVYSRTEYGTVVGGIRRSGGVAYANGTLFWTDYNYIGRPAELYRLDRRDSPPELIREISEELDGPWWADQRLWMITSDETSSTLLEVDPHSGEMEAFALDHVPWNPTMTDDGFVSWDGEQLRWQPLP